MDGKSRLSMAKSLRRDFEAGTALETSFSRSSLAYPRCSRRTCSAHLSKRIFYIALNGHSSLRRSAGGELSSLHSPALSEDSELFYERSVLPFLHSSPPFEDSEVPSVDSEPPFFHSVKPSERGELFSLHSPAPSKDSELFYERSELPFLHSSPPS
jgi:hypothetical protein